METGKLDQGTLFGADEYPFVPGRREETRLRVHLVFGPVGMRFRKIAESMKRYVERKMRKTCFPHHVSCEVVLPMGWTPLWRRDGKDMPVSPGQVRNGVG